MVKTWAEAFPEYDPMSYVDVDSTYSGYTADGGIYSLPKSYMFNGKISGLNYW